MAAAKATGGVLHGPKRSDHTREEEECSEWYSFFFFHVSRCTEEMILSNQGTSPPDFGRLCLHPVDI
jgi:hypothetical protein